MKVFKIAVSYVAGFLVGFFVAYKLVSKSINEWKRMSDKHFAILRLFNQWMIVRKEGGSIAEYLREKGYSRVIIYGMSYAGQRLLDDLAESKIEVITAIDRNAGTIEVPISILLPQDEFPDADCIIVTAIYSFSEIKEMLSHKVNCPILSLEDILYKIS